MATTSKQGLTRELVRSDALSTARGRLRILLAEDDHDMRESLTCLLQEEGHEVLALSNGAELLNYLAGWILEEEPGSPADLIITDIRMPGFSGLSIVEGLRADGWTQPVIVISAFGDEEIKERVSRLGGVVFFSKPIDPCMLERAIMQVASDC